MEITKVRPIYDVGFSISWLQHNGVTAPIINEFGELSVEITDDGNIFIDTESMGKDHFLKLMELLYDMAEVK